MVKKYFTAGSFAFLDSLSFVNLIRILVTLDIKRRYRRSFIGPFWTAISLSVSIFIVTAIFTSIGNGSILSNLPYTAIGMLLWHFISTNILEACDAFVNASTIIRQSNAPMFVYVYRVIARNIVVFSHNLVILILIYFVTDWKITSQSWMSIVGFILLTINLFFLAIILSILTARFRDVGQFVTNLLPIFFYITPIIWRRGFSDVVNRIEAFITYNPFYASISVIREPLLGETVDSAAWIVVVLTTAILGILSIYCYGRFYKRVAFWL
jgi:lipopolysaccharide transport system permease protein